MTEIEELNEQLINLKVDISNNKIKRDILNKIIDIDIVNTFSIKRQIELLEKLGS